MVLETCEPSSEGLRGVTESAGPEEARRNMLKTAGAEQEDINPSMMNYVRGAKALMRIMRKMVKDDGTTSHYDNKPYEEIVDIPDIMAIRRTFKRNLMNAFGQQYGRTFSMDYCVLPGRQIAQLKVYCMLDRQAKSYFVVSPFPIYDQEGGIGHVLYRCDCLFSFKTGVPCAHEIQATMLNRSSLFHQFRQDFGRMQMFQTRGRPRKTHRNTEK
jgi:hypothetical protein